jgi:azurin
MRRNLLTVLALFLVAASLVWAGTYSVTTTAAQDNRLEKQRVRLNKDSCRAVNLPDACTQAQCRNVNANCNIYSDVADLIDREVVKKYSDSLKTNDTRDDQTQFFAFWNNPATTVGQRNTVCSTSGLPNGCELCLP